MNTILKMGFSALLLAMTACAGSDSDHLSKEDTATYWVNSSKTECSGVGKMMCLQVAKSDALEGAKWELFYTPIEGFTFESGYFQKIEVKEDHLDLANVPADASSIKYTLVKVLNKQQDFRMKINDIWIVSSIGDIVIGKSGQNPRLEIKVGSLRVSGTDGCNNIMGSISSLTDTNLTFGPIAGTRKMCRDMQVPDAFNKAINKVAGYSLDGSILSLKDATGKELLKLHKTD